LFPNTIILPADSDLPKRGIFRTRYNFSPNEFLAIYAGNLGVKQGLEILMAAAELLRAEHNIRIIMAGDGAARESLEAKLRDRNLGNISMLPLQFGSDYKELLVDADVSLITQQSGSGNAFFPSKLLVTLAHSSPVVTVADEGSALARVVAEGQFGKNIVPGRPDQLAKTFQELAENQQLLRRWGEKGRAYVQRFEQRGVLEKFVEQLKSLRL
jgi:colanic acid biosynthesis glycosyl transferase WcaI